MCYERVALHVHKATMYLLLENSYVVQINLYPVRNLISLHSIYKEIGLPFCRSNVLVIGHKEACGLN